MYHNMCFFPFPPPAPGKTTANVSLWMALTDHQLAWARVSSISLQASFVLEKLLGEPSPAGCRAVHAIPTHSEHPLVPGPRPSHLPCSNSLASCLEANEGPRILLVSSPGQVLSPGPSHEPPGLLIVSLLEHFPLSGALMGPDISSIQLPLGTFECVCMFLALALLTPPHGISSSSCSLSSVPACLLCPGLRASDFGIWPSQSANWCTGAKQSSAILQIRLMGL